MSTQIAEKKETAAQRNKVRDMVYIAFGAALMAICAWISIPTTIPFTLQTFGVFLIIGLLGGKRGTLSVVVYILLGAVGLPVFSNFKGGIGSLLGTTGGYIAGFLFSALLMWAVEKFFGRKMWILIVSMVAGLVVCYAFGTVWFMAVYAKNSGAIGIGAVLSMCVFPYIIPDLIKIALASLLVKTLRPYVE